MPPASPTLREWLKEAPFGLTMSSGFFAFFAHTGLLIVLEDAGLLPSRVSGSSAGALVTASWAMGLDGPALATELEALERRHFWDPAPGLGLLRGRLFREKLTEMFGAKCMDQGRVPAAVSVHEPMPARTHVLTSGDAAAAVHASCAVPVLFHPVRIGARLYVDGGVSDRPGLRGMPSGERVLFHHIASRSPWRRFDLEGMRVPPREDMITLVIDDLPRSGPFKLDLGRRALREARRAARMALDRPIGSGKVHVSAW